MPVKNVTQCEKALQKLEFEKETFEAYTKIIDTRPYLQLDNNCEPPKTWKKMIQMVNNYRSERKQVARYISALSRQGSHRKNLETRLRRLPAW